MSTNGNGGDICPTCVEVGYDLLIPTTSLGSTVGKELVRSNSEIRPGCPSLKEGEEGLGLLVAITHYRHVICELGPD